MEIAFAVGVFITTFMVVVGLLGEYKEGEWWKRNVRIFEMLVVLGVAGEMLTETGAFWYSLKFQGIEAAEIVSAQQTANNSALQAGKLGVTVNNLNGFVASKESEAEDQFKKLKAYVAAEDARNAGVVAELKKDKEALDKARNDAVGSVTSAKQVLADMEAELDTQRAVREQMLQVMAPRDLSTEQIAKIGTALKQFSGQSWTVTAYWDSKEPLTLANKIFAALNAAGWRYDNEGTKSMMLGGIEGVQISVHPDANPKTKVAADALATILNAERISTILKQQNDPGHPNERLWITVGSKP